MEPPLSEAVYLNFSVLGKEGQKQERIRLFLWGSQKPFEEMGGEVGSDPAELFWDNHPNSELSPLIRETSTSVVPGCWKQESKVLHFAFSAPSGVFSKWPQWGFRSHNSCWRSCQGFSALGLDDPELHPKYMTAQQIVTPLHSFPCTPCQLVVEGLISTEEDSSLLISRFQEYLEHDDVRYFVMKAVAENVGHVMQKNKEVPAKSRNRVAEE